MNKITLEQAEYWSNLQRISVDMRLRGNKIDMKKLDEGIRILTPEVVRLHNLIKEKVYKKDTFYQNSNNMLKGIDLDFEIDSPKQLAAVLTALGYRLPKTATGLDSSNGKWLKENKDDQLIALIIEYRSTKKILNDFFIKIKEMQKYTCPEAWCGGRYGRIFPELNILGANGTGRTSSSNPNEQNIPKWHEKYGQLIRSIFVPEHEGNKLYVMDYSNQEGRLQVHDAYRLGIRGASSVRHELVNNPSLDLHKLTYASMFQIKYEDVTKEQKNFVKPINLGLSYGMQSGSLAKSIGKPTKTITTLKGYKMEVAGEEAQKILDLHKEMQSYVYGLIDKCKEFIKKKGYITTVGERKLYKDKYRDYTAISKRIQGSAADLGYETFRLSYEQGILPLLFIHDEFVVEGLDNARKVEYNMRHAYKISVPMEVETKEGFNWGETELIELNQKEEIK